MGWRSTTRIRPGWRAASVLLLVPAMVVSSPLNLFADDGGARSHPAVEQAADPVVHPMTSRAWTRVSGLEDLRQRVGDAAGRRALSAKGTRIWTASELSAHDLPAAAEKAYKRAAARMAETDPGCQLPWTLLAGIGRVESDHGRYDGARLGKNGQSRPRIIGLQLNGTGPVAAIRDTDNGRLDRDKVWDRAVGPMQFIPSTWAAAARDGDGDRRRSPHDLDDAAAAASSYLCAGSGSLRDPGTQAAAIFRYNQDDYYVALVQAFEVGYRTGVFVIPPPPVEEEPEAHRKKRKRPSVRARTHVRTSEAARPASKPQAAFVPSKPSDDPEPEPAPKPTTKPSPQPSPTPEPQPAPAEVQAQFTACEGGYCLGGKLLDLGVVAQTEAQAAGDFDGDGAVETNGQEVEGMLGTSVTMVVVTLADGRLGILSINGVSLPDA